MLRKLSTAAVLAVALVGTMAVPAAAAPTTPTVSVTTAEQARTKFMSDLLALERATAADLRSGVLSANTPGDVSRAQPDGWWGWTVCLGTVASWAAGNAFVAAKIATLVKRAGNLRRAIQVAQSKVKGYPKSRTRWTAIALIGGVGGEIAGIGGVVAACF